MSHDLVLGILKNNHGSISKAITLIENSQSPPEPFLVLFIKMLLILSG